MSGWFAASYFYRRAPLAFGLCLLAFLFALEAKTAWYGPAAGFGGSVRAAKAQPATSPEVVDHGVPAPDPAHPNATFVALPAMVIVLILCIPAQDRGNVYRRRASRFPAASSSFSNLFRPPPSF